MKIGIITVDNNIDAYLTIDNVVLEESAFLSDLNEDFIGIADDSPLPDGWAGQSGAPWTGEGRVLGITSNTLRVYTDENNDAIIVLPGIQSLSEKMLSFTAEVEFPVDLSQLEVFVKSSQTSSVEGLTSIANYTFGSNTPETITINMPALGVSSEDGNYVAFKIRNRQNEVDGNVQGFVRTRFDNFSTVNASDVGLVSRYAFTNGSRSDDVGSSGTLFLVTNDFNQPPASTSDRFGVGSNALATGFEQYVRVSNPVIDITQDFTINEWFNITAFGNEDGATLFDSRFRADRSQGGGLTLLAMKSGSLNLGTFTSTGGFQNTLSLTNFGKFRQNEWHMATISRESGTVYVYLDGQLVGSGVPTDIENGAIWSLGGQNDNRPLRGKLDDVLFYNQALDPALINDLFLSGGFNKNRNPVDITLSAGPIPEDSPIGTVIGTFSTTDADVGDTHTYEIVGDANIPMITLDGADLIVEGQLNAEGMNPLRFNITTTDASGLTFTKLVEFEILDVNESPTDIAFNSASATGTTITKAENNSNLSVGTFIAIDEDDNDSHTFSISGEDADAFEFTDNLLNALSSFDYETDSIYLFSITAEDAGGASFSKDYTLKITDNNDAPIDLVILDAVAPDTVFVNEMNAPNDSIATFFTVDQDTADTHQYEFVNSSASDPIFSINGNVLTADIVFDHETTPSYVVGIRTLDPDFEQTTTNFVVMVNDVNEAPTDLFFIGANQSFRADITENNAVGDSIASIGVTDQDVDETFTFELSGTGAEDFVLEENLIRAARIFDHETEERTTYTLTIIVTDSQGLTYSEVFNINIIDEAEFGPNQEVAIFDFTAGSLEDEINSYEAYATEFSGGTKPTPLFPQLTPDRFDVADNGLQFDINRSLAVSEPILDFTQSFSINLWFQLDFDIADGSAQFLLQHAGLQVYIDGQENLTVQGSNNNTTVFQVKPQTTLATAQWYMLTIVGDRESTTNQVRVFLNNETSTDADFPTINSASLGGWTIGSASGQLELLGKIDDVTFFQKALQISEINDLWANYGLTGSAPTDITLSSNSIAEDLPAGSTVGTLSTTDVDVEDIHNYTISGPDGGSFSIVDDQLRSAFVFDFETKAQYNIDITTDDGNGGTFLKSFIITINDVAENNAPTDISITSDRIVENRTIGTLVGYLATSDSDASDTHSYSIAGPDTNSFNVGVPSGSETNQPGLLASEVFNFEIKSSYSIEITTNDGNGGSFTKSLVISIDDVNDAPTQINLSNATIDENEAAGQFIGYFTTTDEDNGDTHNISLAGTDAASFTVGSEFVEGPGNVYVLRSEESFDFEMKDSYLIEVSSTDAGGLSVNQNFTISIIDVAQESSNPTDITLSNQTIEENQPVGTIIGTLSTLDPDESETHTYSLSGENSSKFTIDGNTLSTTEVFDFNQQASYDLDISSDDGNGGFYTKSFVITVLEEGTITLSTSTQNEIVIYPNPVSEILFVDLGHLKGKIIRLLTMDGKTIRQSSNVNSISWKIAGINAGTYLLQIETTKTIKSEIIIIR